jgi:hypothetical protein
MGQWVYHTIWCINNINKKERMEELFLSTVSTKPFKDLKGSPKIELAHKYQGFIDDFNKAIANILLEPDTMTVH